MEEPDSTSSSCVVVTCKLNEDKLIVIESFVAFHLASGFDHIYICVDSDTLGLEFFSWLSAVYCPKYLSIIRPLEGDRFQQQHCPASYRQAAHVREHEVQVRQLLNVEMCEVLAAQQGLRWILHIDMDELFYLGPQANSSAVALHFASLEAQNIGTLTYANHEAVPETVDCVDYYRALTLFRRHHFQLQLSTATTAGMNYWTQRTTYHQYFLLYDCGKSASRTGIGALPSSVHQFKLAKIRSGNEAKDSLQARAALIDPRHLSLESVLHLQDGYPCVLHYGCPGISWLHDKYSILGNFPDYWKMLDGTDLPIAQSFHLECRDAVHEGCPEQIRTLFEQQVLFPVSDGTELKKQLECGVLMRIDGPSVFLTRVQRHGLFCRSEGENGATTAIVGTARVALLRQIMDQCALDASMQGAVEPAANIPVHERGAECDGANNNQGSAVSQSPLHGRGISPADRLRLISQSAFQFL